MTKHTRNLLLAATPVVAGAIVGSAIYTVYKRRRRLNPVTVSKVDLNRYAGRWYEIARFPQRFERNCTNVEAHYTQKPDGSIQVINRCLKNGKLKVSTGKATVTDTYTNSKLKVSFFWPIEGDYWIIGLDRDYKWALVGSPDGDALWILSRNPVLAQKTLAEILAIAAYKGYNLAKLEYTKQVPALAKSTGVTATIKQK